MGILLARLPNDPSSRAARLLVGSTNTQSINSGRKTYLLLASLLAVFIAVGLAIIWKRNQGAHAATAQIPVEITHTSSLSSDKPILDDAAESQATNSTNSSTQLSVNGQSVPVPENGSVHKEIDDENGHTTVDASSKTSESTKTTESTKSTETNHSSVSTTVHSSGNSANFSLNIKQEAHSE